ncbi:hypothetical protein Tco_1030010 [Tanacetum coccineum]|uniref:Uncharacterized protein n=1 Tax=Tanacetum coccineum TaxID=301880 RepID=A0ABQ5G5M2_9ASTR
MNKVIKKIRNVKSKENKVDLLLDRAERKLVMIDSSSSDIEDEDYGHGVRLKENSSKDEDDSRTSGTIGMCKATPTANLPYGMFLTRLYRYVMETYSYLDNGTYDIVERVMRPPALRQTRRPRSDCGKARHSISSFSSHHQGTSSYQHDDDDDDVETSRASTPSPTTYINSLHPLDYQN